MLYMSNGIIIYSCLLLILAHHTHQSVKESMHAFNVSKTCYMSFTTSRKRGCSPMFRLFIGQDAIAKVDNTKFLGVYMDENLKWSSHIKIIANKIAKK